MSFSFIANQMYKEVLAQVEDNKGTQFLDYTQTGAHYPERATSTFSCNGVFTSKFIFRYAFPAKITVPGDVMTSASLQI